MSGRGGNMILTPPTKKQKAEAIAHESPSTVGRLVIYEDNPPAAPPPELYHLPSGHVLCIYQCSQLEVERKKFRDQFLYAEQELAAAKACEQMLHDQLQKEVNNSQERFKKQLESYNELQGSCKMRRTFTKKLSPLHLLLKRKQLV